MDDPKEPITQLKRNAPLTEAFWKVIIVVHWDPLPVRFTDWRRKRDTTIVKILSRGEGERGLASVAVAEIQTLTAVKR